MWIFLVRRLLALIPVALLVVLITFSLIHLVPGNPAYTILGEQASATAVRLLDAKLGLDKPLPVEFVQYLWQVAHGNLGQSLVDQQSVMSLIVTRLPVTVELAVLAMLLSLAVAIPTGIVAAVRPNTWIDAAARFLALAGAAVPNFWMALVLVLVFAVTLRWLPALGWAPLSQGLGQNLVHLVMPMIVLALPLAAVTSRVLRGEMLEVLHNFYIQAARAKGLPETRVILKHAFRNALIPVVTVLGLQLGGLLGGVVITEEIFSLPGMGQLVVNAIFERDYPVLQGTVLFMALAVLVANLAVDVVYAFIDPRIQYR
jgi:peptide/nickel transport system permease protein